MNTSVNPEVDSITDLDRAKTRIDTLTADRDHLREELATLRRSHQQLTEDHADKLCARAINPHAFCKRADETAQALQQHFRTVVESVTDLVWEVDNDGVYTYLNPRTWDLLGYESEALIGKTPFDLMPRDEARRVAGLFDAAKPDEGGFAEFESVRIHKDGHLLVLATSGAPFFDCEGKQAGWRGTDRDITHRKYAERQARAHREELARHTADLEAANLQLRKEISEGQRREEIIGRQTKELLEISTPVLQIAEGVVLSVLIGAIDSQRMHHFIEVLLERVAETNAEVALVDITGVPVVDTRTAHHLVEAVVAVRLLGAHVILTGVRPTIAQTVVHLGIDLSDIDTHSSLAEGLRLALVHQKSQAKREAVGRPRSPAS